MWVQIIVDRYERKKIKPNDKPFADRTGTGLRVLSANKGGRRKWHLRFVSPTARKRRDGAKNLSRYKYHSSPRLS